MDLITHVLFQHYDPTWLFLNEQKLDLANRLSKQKEREKQILIDKLDSISPDERFSMIQKQKMGISNWHQGSAENASEYVKSEEYSNHTESERQERIKEIYSQSNIELDFLNSQNNNDEIEDIPQSAITLEEEGDSEDIEFDEEDDDYQNEHLDDEQEQLFNE